MRGFYSIPGMAGPFSENCYLCLAVTAAEQILASLSVGHAHRAEASGAAIYL